MILNQRDYTRMLGLEKPWRIDRFTVDHEAKQIVIEVACDATIWIEDGRRLHIHSWENREWRHLDWWQYTTVLRAPVPRVQDPATSKTQLVQVPWADKFSRWTRAFEAFAIEVVQMTTTIQRASQLLGLNWHSLHRIMERAVARGLERRQATPIEYLGIDEKSFLRGQNYISVVTDLQGRRVLDVKPGADKETAMRLLEQTLNPEQRAQVKAVAMDRSGIFGAAVPQVLPKAEIVYDSFHLMADLNKAVDQTRRQEHARLKEQGDERLKGTRFLWLYDPANLNEEQLQRFEPLAQLALKTSRAWMHKELFKGLYEQPNGMAGKIYFQKWARKARQSRLPAVTKVVQSFEASLKGILNWFEHRISNGLGEGLNSVIQGLKTAARGFRNASAYRTRILFFAGKLDLSL